MLASSCIHKVCKKCVLMAMLKCGFLEPGQRHQQSHTYSAHLFWDFSFFTGYFYIGKAESGVLCFLHIHYKYILKFFPPNLRTHMSILGHSHKKPKVNGILSYLRPPNSSGTAIPREDGAVLNFPTV